LKLLSTTSVEGVSELPADPPIRFLVDENVPAGVTTFLRDRGHEVFPVGEYLTKGSPDQLLIAAAEREGMVVITFDRDFKRLVKQLPRGSRGRFERGTGRISLTLEEPQALGRIRDLIETIEFLYRQANRSGNRFVLQISATSMTVVG
jgi:hypothetical protein